MKNKNIIILSTVFIVVLALVVGAKAYYTNNLKAVTSNSGVITKTIEIPKGSNIKHISKILINEKLIRSNDIFTLYCKINKVEGKLKAGKYTIGSNQSVPEIVDKFILGKGEFDTIRFTIPEGYEIRQIIDKLEAQGLIERETFEREIKEANFDFSFIVDNKSIDYKLEGYLYPDTYEIFKGDSERRIIEVMLQRFDEVFTEEYKQRAKELNMNLNDVITLASIIEREAKLDSERKIISGVFYNRIKKQMMLQSCATVQYILKERKEVLLYKDLEIESPYNTYKYQGLPPGPIASPGLKSIEAALYPEKVDYLYFVANKDGSHVFTKTYKEHLNAQNKINN